LGFKLLTTGRRHKKKVKDINERKHLKLSKFIWKAENAKRKDSSESLLYFGQRTFMPFFLCGNEREA
jgi:hypothetical protein